MTKIAPGSSGEEVIVNSSSPTSLTKQPPSRKNHFFTWFYDKLDDIDPIIARAKTLCIKGTYQTEICPKTKNPHIHMMLWGKGKWRDTELKIPRQKDGKLAYWAEPLKDEKNKSDYANKNDESYDGKVRGSWGFPKPLKLISELKDWQLSIEQMCLEDPDDRIINILVDPVTKQGKTQFCKYMMAKHNAIGFTGGECKDIACQLAQEVENGRDLNEKTIMIFNYGEGKKPNKKPLENVKDGLISSPKYKSSTMLFNSPHIWVFCNHIGDDILKSTRKDVWRIWNIRNNELVDTYNDVVDEFN